MRLERIVCTAMRRADQWLYERAAISNTRHTDPYATHLPVLVGLARLFSVRHVIEYGTGTNSTLTFLDRAAFPDLQSLRAFENSHDWYEQVTRLAASDYRCTLTFVEGLMCEAARAAATAGIDLVFVDDSFSAAERAETIRAVAAGADPGCLIVIHDYEVIDYRWAARRFAHRHVFTAFTPHTALLWNAAQVDVSRIRALDAAISQYAAVHQPADRRAWVRLFEKLPGT